MVSRKKINDYLDNSSQDIPEKKTLMMKNSELSTGSSDNAAAETATMLVAQEPAALKRAEYSKLDAADDANTVAVDKAGQTTMYRGVKPALNSTANVSGGRGGNNKSNASGRNNAYQKSKAYDAAKNSSISVKNQSLSIKSDKYAQMKKNLSDYIDHNPSLLADRALSKIPTNIKALTHSKSQLEPAAYYPGFHALTEEVGGSKIGLYYDKNKYSEYDGNKITSNDSNKPIYDEKNVSPPLYGDKVEWAPSINDVSINGETSSNQ